LHAYILYIYYAYIMYIVYALYVRTIRILVCRRCILCSALGMHFISSWGKQYIYVGVCDTVGSEAKIMCLEDIFYSFVSPGACSNELCTYICIYIYTCTVRVYHHIHIILLHYTPNRPSSQMLNFRNIILYRCIILF